MDDQDTSKKAENQSYRILQYCTEAEVVPFTRKLISLAKLCMRRNSIESQYNVPSKDNWRKMGPFMDEYSIAYDQGWSRAKVDHSAKYLFYDEAKNPYRPSNHERDQSYSDELNYWWWNGYSDYADNFPQDEPPFIFDYII